MLKQIPGPMLRVLGGIWGQHPVLFTFLGIAIALLALSRLPGVKGWIGETTMKVGFALLLPKEAYHAIHNVTIPDGEGGTTQIDHVVVSVYGVFVVETKHYKGWLFGGEDDRTWTQKIHGGHSQKFQNPLRQNFKHTECLAALLGLDRSQVQSVVVFTGDCTLETRDKLPPNVTYPGSCVRYIRGQTRPVLDQEQVQAVEAAIQEGRLAPTRRTAREHVAYVKSLHPDKPPAPAAPVAVEVAAPAPAAPVPAEAAPREPVCPRCGAPMVLRTAKRGANAGGRFWGCSNYPQCREVMDIAEEV